MKTLRKKAFTMVELIFVIIVLGILSTIALPKFMATQNTASEANVKQQIQSIRASIESKKMQNIEENSTLSQNGGGINDGNLTLYYNYRPWEGQTYLDGNSSVIMQGASTFQFKAVGDLLKVQLCVSDSNISGDEGYSICKEKTIF